MGRESVVVAPRPTLAGVMAPGTHFSQQQGSSGGPVKPEPQAARPRDPAVLSLKKVDLDQNMISGIQNEIKAAQKMKGVSCVRTLNGVREDQETVTLTFSASGQPEITLLDYTKKLGRLEEEHAKFIFAQLATALAYCHERMVIHRDLKLPNIFINPVTGKVRVGDFSRSTVINSHDELMNDRCGSPAYIGPEIVVGQPYSGQAADCWSLGVVLYALLCGVFPFVDNAPMMLFEKIVKANPEYPAHLSAQAVSLLQGLLKPVPFTRLTALKALNHPWLRGSSPSSSSSSDADDDSDEDQDQMVPNIY